jgi:hypothetical protein
MTINTRQQMAGGQLARTTRGVLCDEVFGRTAEEDKIIN